MSKRNQDQLQNWNEEPTEFEQQLRSIEPVPPKKTWSSVAQAIDASQDLVSAKPKMNVWRSILSHCVTAAVGLVVGVAIMESRLPESAPAIIRSSGIGLSAADVLTTNEGQEMIHHPPSASLRSSRSDQAREVSTTLRAYNSISCFHRLVSDELNSVTPQHDSGAGDLNEEDVELEELPAKRPVLSPRSSLLLLDDLT